MGGRLDSTNVVAPLVSVITNIDLEHTEFLGDTLEPIAGEKAGIIKPGVPVVSGARQPEALKVIENVGSGRGLQTVPARQGFQGVGRRWPGRSSASITPASGVFAGMSISLRGGLPGGQCLPCPGRTGVRPDCRRAGREQALRGGLRSGAVGRQARTGQPRVRTSISTERTTRLRRGCLPGPFGN